MTEPSILPSIKYLMGSAILAIALSSSVLSDALLSWRPYEEVSKA